MTIFLTYPKIVGKVGRTLELDKILFMNTHYNVIINEILENNVLKKYQFFGAR